MLPLLEATVCFLRKGNETLFIDYRNYPHPLHKGKFASPGGKINSGEDRESAVKREIKEETGIVINCLIYRGEVTFLNESRTFSGKPAKYNFRVYCFDSYDFDDSRALATEGVFAWTQNDKIKDLPMHEGDKVVLDLLNKYRVIKAEIIHMGEKMTEAKLISKTN